MDASSTRVLQSVVRLHWLALRQHRRINSRTHTMPTTYEESVNDCADEYGNLSLKAAEQLFKDHGSDYWDAHKQGMELTLKSHKLLSWLGY